MPVLGAEADRAAALGFLPRATASGVAFARFLSIDLGPHLERAGGVAPAAPDELVRLCLPAAAGSAPAPEGPVAVLDIETLGLHGSGVLAFLVGLGSVRGRQLEVEQLLLADPDGEEALLEAVASWVEAHPVVLTYNGRGFDIPALATRCILNRMDPAVMEPRLHADLLGPVRRLFRDRLAACTLRQAELALLGLERVADVPGSEAPRRYRLWLGGGPASILRGVVRHNQLDLCATAVLGARLAAHVAGDHVLPEHPADRCRLALHHERAGSPEEHVDAYLREALAGGRDPWACRAGHRLARRLARRSPPEREEARAVWRRLWEARPTDLVAARALTAGLERAGDLEGALEVARRAGRLSSGMPASRLRPGAAEGWDRRIARLERRLELRRAHRREAGSGASVSLEWAPWMSPSRLPTRA